MTSTPDLSAFIKAYDVRGLVGTQLTDEVVEALGAGFVDELGVAGQEVVDDLVDSSAAAFETECITVLFLIVERVAT